jgi:hypothetical protein
MTNKDYVLFFGLCLKIPWNLYSLSQTLAHKLKGNNKLYKNNFSNKVLKKIKP